MPDAHVVHLYNRLGFGLAPAELRALRGRSRAEVVGGLLTPPPPRSTVAAEMESYGPSDPHGYNTLRDNWVERMAAGGHRALTERMSLFWHGHFACMARRLDDAAEYLDRLYAHGAGSFRDLLHAIVEDRALLRYLNAQVISKDDPNENFAREILELFTVGIESYTEEDVRGFARAMAGWLVWTDGNRFDIRESEVDHGAKLLLGRRGTFVGHEAIDVILDDPRCGRFIVRRLWRYLTDDDPSDELVARHATVFAKADLNISALLESIAMDDAFYAPDLLRARVKSPLDLVVQWHRNLGAHLADGAGAVLFARINGLFLLVPPNVAGWPGGRDWLSTSTLPARMALAEVSVSGSPQRYRPDPNFESIAGTLTREAAAVAADPDLSVVTLGAAGLSGDAVALGSHPNYQYG